MRSPNPAAAISLAAMASVLMSSATASAADIAATSRIDAVTVFPSSAEITRLAKVRLPAGEHTIVLKDLPASAVAQSIRVEGKSSGPLAIGAVDSQRTFLTDAETAVTAAERHAIELEIEKIGDEKALLQSAIEAAQAQKKLIANLVELPARPLPVGATPAAQPDWAALTQLIGQQTAAAQKTILETGMKLRDADKRMVELRKKLAPIAGAQYQRLEVKIAVSAQAAVDGEFTIRYQVGNAAWTPFYDARLTTGSRTVNPGLQLVRRASIQQRTGEPWDNVALTLSTTRPTQGSQAPELRAQLIDFFEPRPMGGMVGATAPAAAPAPAVRAQRRADLKMTEQIEDAAKPKEAAAELKATIEGNAFQALYGIPGRHTVPSTSEVKRVQIDQSDVDVALVVRTVPKLDPRAFLYAKLTTPKTTAILAGNVSLFRDGTFVGQGQLPQLAPGEERELGFGQDDNVRVKYAVTEEKRGETGLISTSKTEAKSFKVSVKSLHQRPIQVRVVDQFPVALNQDIKVETTAKIPPTGKDLDDVRGVAFWDFALAPDEERVLDFGYRLTWPSAKNLTRH